ncbi:GNAT family N-acetyltransferase [Allorhizocola rhizosphaerae]|uniref:GNAT family N-acetyltransferase n=1 Tax=Allorhizocola rhizosphaerae TaxID=1872709 RepID=UPI000E3E0D9A|nr:GNAT family N-acetyltransferase [Allorhizocola rhizosphaerae]
MTFRIRPGTAADVDPVGELHTLIRNETYKDIISGYRAESTTAFWRQRFPVEAGTHRLLIAHADDGSLLGFVYVGEGVLQAIHVHPDWHGRGVGQALIQAGRKTLAELGFRFASLWVIAGNERACRFYERDGWRLSGLVRDGEMGGVSWPQLEYVREL